MTTATQLFNTKYDTYAPGYSRKCPSCGQIWATGKLAIRCWYEHPNKQGGSDALEKMKLSTIANIMGLSEDTVRKTWHWLEKIEGAPHRFSANRTATGNAYVEVVRFVRRKRQAKHGLGRGWTQKLADKLSISRQRVSQLRMQAIRRGDLH